MAVNCFQLFVFVYKHWWMFTLGSFTSFALTVSGVKLALAKKNLGIGLVMV